MLQDYSYLQRLSLVHDCGGAGSFISKLPSFFLTEAEAESLALCGSIKDLTLCTAHDIVSYTELSYERSAFHCFHSPSTSDRTCACITLEASIGHMVSMKIEF